MSACAIHHENSPRSFIKAQMLFAPAYSIQIYSDECHNVGQQPRHPIPQLRQFCGHQSRRRRRKASLLFAMNNVENKEAKNADK
jgi:hypothetical protein